MPPITTPSKMHQESEVSWTLTMGLDCYEGVGGVPLQPDPWARQLTLTECQTECKQESACVAIIRDVQDEDGPGLCYLRQEIQTDQCVQDPQWHLHMINRGSGSSATPATTPSPTKEWSLHPGLDCYEGVGGDPISPDPLPNSVNLAECQETCLADSSCQGVVRETSDGDELGLCYLRTNLRLDSCEQGTKWQLH